MENSQGQLRNMLAKATNDTERRDQLADLAERLLATERREIDLKEKAHALTKAEKELQLALSEQKRSNDELRADLKDQDEVLTASASVQQENQRLAQDLSRLRESESFLTGRVDELEQESAGLRDALNSKDKKIWDRERRWQEKLDSLEDELTTSLTTSASVAVEEAKREHSLKIEVEGLKTKAGDLTKALSEKNREAEKADAAFRSEVSLAATSNTSMTAASDGQSRPKNKTSSLVRYRSLRDHNGRFYLVVKIH